MSKKGKKKEKLRLSKEKNEAETEKEKTNEQERKIAELEDTLLRLRAEFDNYHKRTDKEIERLKKTANKSLILDLIDFLDELEESMKYINKDGSDAENIKQGFEMLYSKLLLTLKKNGLEELTCEGKMFDPYKHEALMFEKSDKEGEDGKITKVLKKGYLLNGELIRHASVCVAKEKTEDETKEEIKEIKK